jgi:aspartyl-tRNA synthetase
MITKIEKPIVEAFRLRPDPRLFHGVPDDIAAIFRRFMETLPKEMTASEDGVPAMLVVDSSKPMMGLSSLGHDGFARLTSGGPGLQDFENLEDGDVLFMQARFNEPFHGGSTILGNLRNLIYAEAVNKGLLKLDWGYHFLWVTEFPMFTPDLDKSGDPGQGGKNGFSATHHPFTAPLTEEDFDLMATDPLRAKADHYDLVLNGVELGGGSRRIHVAELQEYVFRYILRMSKHGIGRFSGLLDALRAGCPPHAGFALGFDRLVAMLSGTESVRDVIAFPKTMKGTDPMVKSPSFPEEGVLEEYHLTRIDSGTKFRKIPSLGYR